MTGVGLFVMKKLLCLLVGASLSSQALAGGTSSPDESDQFVEAVTQICRVGFKDPQRMITLINGLKSPELRERTKLMCVMYVRGATYERASARK